MATPKGTPGSLVLPLRLPLQTQSRLSTGAEGSRWSPLSTCTSRRWHAPRLLDSEGSSERQRELGPGPWEPTQATTHTTIMNLSVWGPAKVPVNQRTTCEGQRCSPMGSCPSTSEKGGHPHISVTTSHSVKSVHPRTEASSSTKEAETKNQYLLESVKGVIS